MSRRRGSATALKASEVVAALAMKGIYIPIWVYVKENRSADQENGIYHGGRGGRAALDGQPGAAAPTLCWSAIGLFSCGCGLGFGEVGENQAQVAGIRGVGQSGVEIHDSGADQLVDFAVEVLHAFGVPILHGL